MAAKAYARLQRYINAGAGDMSTERRGELVEALVALGYKRSQAVEIVWSTHLDEADTDEDALRAILAKGIDPQGATLVKHDYNTQLLGGLVTIAPKPTGSNIDADTTPITPADSGAGQAPSGVVARLNDWLNPPDALATGDGQMTAILAANRPGPGPSPDDVSQIDTVQLQAAQDALTQVRAQNADADADADETPPPLHPNAAAQFADRWTAGVQPSFDRLAAWADTLPTPGGIGLLLIVIGFFLFAIVPVNGTQTRLSLIFLTLFGHTKLSTPSKPWSPIPNSPIAAGLEGLASATEDIATQIGVIGSAISGVAGIGPWITGNGQMAVAGALPGYAPSAAGSLGAAGVVGSGIQQYLHDASGGLFDFNYGEDGFLPPTTPTTATTNGQGGTQTF
jgi:hypothetical protein